MYSSERKTSLPRHTGNRRPHVEMYSVGNAFDKFPLAVLLHIADLQATYLDETGDKA